MGPYQVHLLIVAHGLWGLKTHVGYICRAAAEYGAASTAPRSRRRANSIPRTPPRLAGDAAAQLADDAEDVRLVVLAPGGNEWVRTYDGIDHCAERIVQEIDQECARIAEDGGKVTRFSIVGYSLGGLVARYVLGLLESRTPSFFAEVRPVNFATFASPAIGIPQYKSAWSAIFKYLGARLLSRSGSQLYENDRFLPSSILDGLNQDPKVKPKGALSRFSVARENAEPLLAVMADPRYNFFKALAAFERIEIYANSVQDRTVPYPTGAIEAHDPFALARARARKAATLRGEDPDSDVDIREGGMEITMSADGAPVIASFREIDPISPAIAEDASVQKKRKYKFKLPLLLRPTTYPFSRPVSLILIVFIPITIPLTILFVFGRFVLQSRESNQRIRQMRVGAGGRNGMLERVGIRLAQAIDDVAETAQPSNPEYAIDGGETRKSELDEEEGERSFLKDSSFSAFATYGGTETPTLTRPVSPGTQEDPTATGSASNPYPTDPVLTPAQIIMIKNLNSIPHMRKHLTYLPTARNSHSIIVARDLTFAQNREGTKVVDAWAKEFRL